MIPFLEAQDKMAPVLLEVPDVGRVGAEAIFDDDDFEVRVVLSEPVKPAA